MIDIFLRVTSVSEVKQGKGGQSYVLVTVQHVEERVGGPKRRSLAGRSRAATATLVLWLPGTEFKIPGSERTLVPTNIMPEDGIEVGQEFDGCLTTVECDPHNPYKWVAEDGSTIVQREVKVAVMATPGHMLYRQMLVEAIASKGIVPADETLRRSTSRIPAAMKVDGQQTPETPEVIVQDPFGSGDSQGDGQGDT